MCRMLMFQGKYREKHWEFFDALIKAAERDHIFGKYRGKKYEQHPDGWGIVIIHHDTQRYIIYKSLKPIFEEKEVLKRLLDQVLEQEVSIIAHARYAGPFKKKNIESVHPFSYITDSATTTFVAHNGALSRGFFGKELKLNEIIVENLCDGHLFTMWIARKWSSLKEALKELVIKNVVKSALNVFMIELFSTKTKPILYAISYLNEEYLKSKGKTEEQIRVLRDYFRVYYYINEIVIFASSTVVDYILTVSKNEWKTLKLEGELISISDKGMNIIILR